MKQPPRKGTKEHYIQVVNHIGNLMEGICEKHPDVTDELKQLFFGFQIINNEYVLKHNPIFNTETTISN